jgi:hypothetical protein
MRQSRGLVLAAIVAVSAMVATAAEPDFSMIEYGEGVGCGLYVQFFKADGTEATKEGKPLAFFPGGAPPSTNPSSCLAKCDEWAGSSLVKDTRTILGKTLGVTRVTGTCYLHGKPLAAPRVLAE